MSDEIKIISQALVEETPEIPSVTVKWELGIDDDGDSAITTTVEINAGHDALIAITAGILNGELPAIAADILMQAHAQYHSLYGGEH